MNYFIFSTKDLENAFTPYLDFLTLEDKFRYPQRYVFKSSDKTNTNIACFFVDEGKSTDGITKLRVGEDVGFRFLYFTSIQQIQNRLAFILDL